MLKLAGLSDGDTRATRILVLETAIAKGWGRVLSTGSGKGVLERGALGSEEFAAVGG